jgi:hypothetical protein
MQGIFEGNQELANSLRSSISKPRMQRYINDAGGDPTKALDLYYWNAQLCQSLYFPIQIWEISIRNKINIFLSQKYNPGWPYDDSGAVRQFTRSDRERLLSARTRQERNRRVQRVSTDAIVADLSAGLWVSLLSESYDNPYAWRYNIRRVFPHDQTLERGDAYTLCGRVLEVRNRIAHHEPIYHLPLGEIRADLARLTRAMCPGAHHYATRLCTFAKVFAAHPLH